MMTPRAPELEPPPSVEQTITPARPELSAISAQPLPIETLKTVLDAAATALAPPRFTAASTALVTELATRLACDRVSLGVVKYGRLHVRALSHSAQFNQKTDLLQAIASAMEEAWDQQRTIVWPSLPGSAIAITHAHEELARRYGAGTICSIPFWAQGHIGGVLTFERGADRPFDRQTVDLCEAVGSLSGPILDLKRRDDRWLLVKAWDAARDHIGQLIGPSHLALKLMVLLIVAIGLFLFTATGDYRVTAKAVLEGEVLRAAVAPFQGYLDTAPVRAGDVVQAGQVLATLQDRDLRLERLKFLSQHEQLAKEYRHALAEREAAKVEIITAQLAQVDAQLNLATDKLARTQIVAPFSGIVVTGDLLQQLGSPVEQGQVLFEVAPLDAYRIVVQVDERDISPIAVGQRGNLLLSALPDHVFPFTVNKITPVATAKEGRNYFRVEGRFLTTPNQLRPAMEGIGKIEIDRRRLVWIWTHEAIDWVRLKLWAWLP